MTETPAPAPAPAAQPEPLGGRQAYLLFVDSFLKVRQWRDWGAMYLRLLRSPTRQTIALAESGTELGAFRFLETSVLLYVVFGLSRVLARQGGMGELVVVPLSLVVTLSASLAVFHLLARRKARLRRSFSECLELSALYVGFNLPISAAYLMALQTSPVAVLAVLPLVLGSTVYTVRVWRAFLGLGAWRVLLYLLVSSIPAGILDLLVLRAAGAWPARL